MSAHMTDADKSVLDDASSAIGLAQTAPSVLHRLCMRWVSRLAIPCEVQEGSQS